MNMSQNVVVPAVLDELRRLFRQATHKRAAHHLARAVMEQASRDPRFITEALRAHVSKPESLNKLNYPVVTVPIEANPYFELVLNCWIPLPTGETDLTTKAIHHHGEMLLSTATMFGPGYEHWLFTRARPKDGPSYTMAPVEARQHRLHETAFVDDYVPHVPLYPSSLSLTLALWSSQSDVSLKDRVKRIPFLKKKSRSLRAAAVRLGLARALDLKVVEYFDFFPTSKGFEAIKDRKEFELGPNEDHLQSLFHVLSGTGNAQLAAVVESTVERGGIQNPSLVKSLVSQLRAGRPIAGRLSENHFNVPFANFRRKDIERALVAQGGGVKGISGDRSRPGTGSTITNNSTEERPHAS